MKHRNYNSEDSWGNGYAKDIKVSQEKMILKGNSEYKPGNWILWIVSEIFCQYETKEVIGHIEITNKQGEEVSVSYLTRKPYPNKRITQLGMRCGRKRLYGIPLVFKTYEELCSIKSIKIRWDVVSEAYMNNKPFVLEYTNYIVDYDLNFMISDDNIDYRFFTIFSKEHMGRLSEQVYDTNEFDNAICFAGNIEWSDTENIDSMLYEYSDLLQDEERELSPDEKMFCEMMEKEKKPYALFNKYNNDTVVGSDVNWKACWYKKSETLKAAYMADFLPDSCFGFER